MEDPVVVFKDPVRKPLSTITPNDFPRGWDPYRVMSYNDSSWPYAHIDPRRPSDAEVVKMFNDAGLFFSPMPPKGDYPIVEFEQKEYCGSEYIQKFIDEYKATHREIRSNGDVRKANKREAAWLKEWAAGVLKAVSGEE